MVSSWTEFDVRRKDQVTKQIFRDSGICLLLIVPSMYTAEIDVDST